MEELKTIEHYIKYDNDGNITGCYQSEQEAPYIKIDCNKHNELCSVINGLDAWKVIDGQFVEKETPLSFYKRNKLYDLDKACKKAIFAVYPEHKQRNITMDAAISGDNSEVTEMKSFIDDKVVQFNIYKDMIVKAQTKEELDKVVINFNE